MHTLVKISARIFVYAALLAGVFGLGFLGIPLGVVLFFLVVAIGLQWLYYLAGSETEKARKTGKGLLLVLGAWLAVWLLLS